MYFLLTLFLISLAGMLIMLGRKMLFAGGSQILHEEYKHPFVPDFERVKRFAWNSTRKYGHMSLVATLRIYVKSGNMIKARYEKARARMNRKNGENADPADKAEASKFLKMMSDYKQKIRDIKHKIREEEKNS